MRARLGFVRAHPIHIVNVATTHDGEALYENEGVCCNAATAGQTEG